MDTIFMNSQNSKTPDPHRYSTDPHRSDPHSDKINIERSDKLLLYQT